MVIKECYFCDKKINMKKKYVLVGTYNIPYKKDNEVFFHFSCWEDYFNERVEAKASKLKTIQASMNFLNSPMVKQMIKNLSNLEKGEESQKRYEKHKTKM